MANVKPEKFLLPEDDGLPMRESGEYAKDKLLAMSTYLTMAMTAVKDRPWRSKYFIDLMSGSGKNIVRDTKNDIFLGSPMVALENDPFFTHYRFNDLHLADVLRQRVSRHPRSSHIQITQEEAEVAAKQVCEEIRQGDAKRPHGKWHSFNIAFVDPENAGQLPWTIIEELAKVNKMDMVINFPTHDIRRNADSNNTEHIDRFFGTEEWKKIYKSGRSSTYRRREMIDFYLSRLQKFGYYTNTDDELLKKDIQFKNSRNVEVYSIIFASKHELGDKLWREAAKRGPRQRPLF